MKVKKEVIQNRYFLALVVITLVSFFLRFVDSQRRWGIAYDQARDVIVTHEALQKGVLPLTGPFSASGQFVFSPLWYWFHIFVTAFNPSSPMFLWISQAFISSLMPIVMYFVGKSIKDKNLGIILAIITAISTSQIDQATNSCVDRRLRNDLPETRMGVPVTLAARRLSNPHRLSRGGRCGDSG